MGIDIIGLPPSQRQEPDVPDAGRSRLLLISLVAAGVVAAVFLRTINHGLYLDDHHHIRPWSFSEVLSTFHGRFDPLGIEPVYFRPLVTVTFALDWALWGWNPVGAHVTNVLLHAAVAALVVVLLVRLRAPRWVALAAGILFGLIPANVATAAYISERSDAMVAIATLGGLLALVSYARDHRTRWLVAMGACYVLAIGSKEVGIAMVLSVAVVWWYLQLPAYSAPADGARAHWRRELRAAVAPFRRDGRRWLAVLGPLVAIALVTVAYRAVVLPGGALSKRYSGESPAKGLVSAVLHALGMVPWELSPIAAPVLALLVLVALVLAPTSRGWRLVVLGVAFVVVTCVPLAWLGQVEPRLLYVAEIGVAFIFAGVLIALRDAVVARRGVQRRGLAVVAVVLVATFGVLTVRGTLAAQDEFHPGSAKMLEADLKIWEEPIDMRERWPARRLQEVRDRLFAAGLITADGEVVTPVPGD